MSKQEVVTIATFNEAIGLLSVAKELFEMLPDCEEVGSDSWVWLQQTDLFIRRYREQP